MPSPPAGASIPAGTISTEIGTGPFSSEEYLTHDGWWNKMNGRAYDVYSGSLYSDPAQGVVVVLSGPADDPTQSGASTLKAFPSPGRDGSLTMTASSGWTITLRATDGATYSFDVATEQYVAG